MTLKVPYGEKDGHLVHIDKVPSGLACNCVCPVCHGRLIARKGDTNTHHFAHHHDANCDGETLLHHLGKRLLYSRISLAISRKEAIPFLWRCRECQDVHEGDLTEMATTVALEESLGKIQPDVTIFGQERKPRVLVEVVVTHEPEPIVWNYADQNDTNMVVFRITENDLGHLERGTPLAPSMTLVAGCIRPTCRICSRPLRRRCLYVVEEQCVVCSLPVQRSIVKTDTPLLQFYGPEGFNDHEIAIAERAGAILKMQASYYFGFSYLANSCPNCSTGSSQLYVYDGIASILIGRVPLNQEYFCPHCETRPGNRAPDSPLEVCITWSCDSKPDIGRVVCSDHLQTYLRGSQAIPFTGLR